MGQGTSTGVVTNIRVRTFCDTGLGVLELLDQTLQAFLVTILDGTTVGAIDQVFILFRDERFLVLLTSAFSSTT